MNLTLLKFGVAAGIVMGTGACSISPAKQTMTSDQALSREIAGNCQTTRTEINGFSGQACLFGGRPINNVQFDADRLYVREVDGVAIDSKVLIAIMPSFRLEADGRWSVLRVDAIRVAKENGRKS